MGKKKRLMALLMVAAVMAQTPVKPPVQTAVTFKANANLVIINVTAKDKGGLAVEGLKAEDFTVLEDGKPQKVSVFEYQRISSKPEPASSIRPHPKSLHP